MIKGIGNNPSFISTMSSKDNIKTENVEKSKVEKIKESINNGTYKIDLDKTAQKIAESLL
jgi:anti-sigma28 factor (negative regulator of flagellin synthesis)